LEKGTGGGEDVVLSGRGDFSGGGTSQTEQHETNVFIIYQRHVETSRRVVIAPVNRVHGSIVSGGGVTDTSVDVTVSLLNKLDKVRMLDASIVPIIDIISLRWNGIIVGEFTLRVTESNVAIGVSQASFEKLSLSSIKSSKFPSLAIDTGKSNKHTLAKVRHIVIKFSVETVGEDERLQGAISFLGIQRGTVTIQVHINLRLLQDTIVGRKDKSHRAKKMSSMGSTL
jgi:hypothetical protein